MLVEERRNFSDLINQFFIKELQVIYPYVNWLEYVNSNLNDIEQVDENEILTIPDKKYFQQLEEILKSTPKRTIANYFAWRLVMFSSNLLNNPLQLLNRRFIKATTGKLNSDRITECIKQTME